MDKTLCQQKMYLRKFDWYSEMFSLEKMLSKTESYLAEFEIQCISLDMIVTILKWFYTLKIKSYALK